MSTLRNRVQLIGHLGADPEIKTIASGAKVAHIRMATTESYRSNGEWKEDTQWHRISAWEKLAERAEKFLSKGSFVMVEGKLVTNSFTDAQGNKKYITEVRAANFILLDKKQGGTEEVAAPADSAEAEDDGLPF